MKKRVIRVMSMLLICLCIISMLAPVSYAATKSSITFTGSKYGGNSKYFYVKTNDTSSSKSVKLTLTKGTMTTSDTTDSLMKNLVKSKDLYAAYEIKIAYWDSKSKTWKQETSYDVYNSSSKTVTLKKSNTYYRIQVYQWKASTTLTSYKNKGVWNYNSNVYVDSPYWSKLPKIKVSSATRCTIYDSNPVK
jgi:hypothetical protein